MKKIWTVVVSFLIIITLTACTSGAADQASSQNDLLEYEYEYFRPVASSIITAQNWDDASQLSPESLVNFFADKTGLSRLSTDAEAVIIPGDVVESYIQLYFAVDNDYIRQVTSYDSENIPTAPYYDRENHTYGLLIPGDWGGAKVVAVSEKDDILSLSYEYYSREDGTTVIREGTIDIQILGPQQYHYISCSMIDKAQAA